MTVFHITVLTLNWMLTLCDFVQTQRQKQVAQRILKLSDGYSFISREWKYVCARECLFMSARARAAVICSASFLIQFES